MFPHSTAVPDGGARRRSTRRPVVVTGLVVATLVLSACNPLVGHTTQEGSGNQSATHSITYHLDEGPGGWLEVQLREGANHELEVSVHMPNGLYESRPCVEDGPDGQDALTTCDPALGGVQPPLDWCDLNTPPRVAWTDGATTGFRRVAWVEPGERFTVRSIGSSEPVTVDVRVLDDHGSPVGELEPWLPGGGFDTIGGPICAP